MRTILGTDQAKPCWKCGSTIASYAWDSEISLVSVRCSSCHASDVFYPLSALRKPSAAELSRQHRGTETIYE